MIDGRSRLEGYVRLSRAVSGVWYSGAEIQSLPLLTGTLRDILSPLTPHERMCIMSRVLALDIGTVRIGAAVSDSLGIIAQGLGVWNAENDQWRKDFDEAVRKYDPKIVVVGLPLRTDGKTSEAASRVSGIVENLRNEYPGIEFVFQDERFTTVIAQQVMIEADTSRRKRRKNVDKVAAVIILQDWLESHR